MPSGDCGDLFAGKTAMSLLDYPEVKALLTDIVVTRDLFCGCRDHLTARSSCGI